MLLQLLVCLWLALLQRCIGNGTYSGPYSVYTYAGGGTKCECKGVTSPLNIFCDGNPATSAVLKTPVAMYLFDSNLYIADTNNNRIRKIDGVHENITTVVGDPSCTATSTGAYGGDNEVATSANVKLNEPSGLTIDNAGNMYIADTFNNRIRKVTYQTGIISTIAGSGATSTSCSSILDQKTNVNATLVQLNNPSGIALNTDQTELYIADKCNLIIRKIDLSTNVITTLAGSGSTGAIGSGAANIVPINFPTGVALDTSNNVYIAERLNRILKFDAASNTISTVAGASDGSTATSSDIGDNGAATSAYLRQPFSVAVANFGTSVELYIADSKQNRVRKVGVDGIIYTIAGDGTNTTTTNSTVYDGDSGTQAQFTSPKGVIVDTETGYVYFATNSNIELLQTAPTCSPTFYPSNPTFTPSIAPTFTPTFIPTDRPTRASTPTYRPTTPTDTPTVRPSSAKPTTASPTIKPTTASPTITPTVMPSAPTVTPTVIPTSIPSTANPTGQPSAQPSSQPSLSPKVIGPLATNLLGNSWDSNVVKAKAQYYLGAYIVFFSAIFFALIIIDRCNIWDKTRTALYDSSFDSGIHLPSFSTTKSRHEEEIPRPEQDPDKARVKRLSKLMRCDKHIADEEMRSQDDLADKDITDGVVSDSKVFSLQKQRSLVKQKSQRLSESGNASFMSSITNRLNKVVSYSKSYHKYLQQERTLLNCAPIIYPEGFKLSIPMLFTIQLPPGMYEDFVIHLCNNHTLIGSFWACKGSFYSRNGRRYVFTVQNCLSFFLTSFSNCSLNLYGLGDLFTNMADVLIISPVSLSAGEMVRYLYVLQHLDHTPDSLAEKLASFPILPRLMVMLLFVGGMALLFLSSMFTYSANSTGIITQYVTQILLVTFVYEIVVMMMKFVSHYHLNVSLFNVSVINIGIRYLEIILRHGLKENIDYFVNIKTFGTLRIEYVVDINYAVKKGWIAKPVGSQGETTNPVHNPVHVVSGDQAKEIELVEENQEDEMDLYGTYNVTDDNVVYDEQERFSIRNSVANPLFQAADTSNEVQDNEVADAVADDMFEDVFGDDTRDLGISEEELATEFENYRLQLLSANRRGSGGDGTEDAEPLSFEEWKLRKFKQGTRKSFVEKYAFFEKLNAAKSRPTSRPTAKPAYMDSFKKSNVLQIKSRPTKKFS